MSAEVYYGAKLYVQYNKNDDDGKTKKPKLLPLAKEIKNGTKFPVLDDGIVTNYSHAFASRIAEKRSKLQPSHDESQTYLTTQEIY